MIILLNYSAIFSNEMCLWCHVIKYTLNTVNICIYKNRDLWTKFIKKEIENLVSIKNYRVNEDLAINLFKKICRIRKTYQNFKFDRLVDLYAACDTLFILMNNNCGKRDGAHTPPNEFCNHVDLRQSLRENLVKVISPRSLPWIAALHVRNAKRKRRRRKMEGGRGSFLPREGR